MFPSHDQGGEVLLGKTAGSYRIDMETLTGGNAFRTTRGTSDFRIFQANNGASYLGTGNDADLNIQTNSTNILTLKNTGEARFGWNSGIYTNPQTIAQFGNTVVADEYGASISSSGNGLAGYFGSNAHWANNAFSKPTSGRSAGYLNISNSAATSAGSAFNFTTVLQGGS